MDYQQRLLKAIPGGCHTYSRGFDQFPSNAPQILSRAKGAYVWDQNKRKFLDYGMGLRAITLGYSYGKVNRASFKQIKLGNNLTRPSLIELEAAEKIIDKIPYVDMVKFAKNGSNVTTAAIKLARAYTGRQYIAIPKQHPFFSFDDWFISKTNIVKGTQENAGLFTLFFDYNNLESLKNLFIEYEDKIAAVMLEPATTEVPYPYNPDDLDSLELIETKKNNFLKDIRKLCNKNKSLLILDEMITGFRWDNLGASHYFDVEPDLLTFGKAMANGFSIAALCGKKEIMEIGSITRKGQERVFLLSSTHGAEMSSLGAFLKTFEIYEKEPVVYNLWKYGKTLKNEANEISRKLGLIDYFSFYGPGICLNYQTRNIKKENCLKFRTLFAQEMMKRNIIMPYVSVSYSHKQNDLKNTLLAISGALKIYKKALESDINNYLDGNSVLPVFRKYN